MRKFLSLLSLLITISCSSSTSSSRRTGHHHYEEVANYSLSYLDVFNVEEENYYIYYYQETCGHCLMIKDDIIEYAIKTKSPPVFFVHIEKDEGFLSHEIEDTLYTSNPLKAFMMVTPQLSLVEHGVITKTVIGASDILLTIE